MKWWKNLYLDYQESRFSQQESFAEWFLKRKLSFWGKIAFAALMWTLWSLLVVHPVWVIYFFHGVLILSVVVMVTEYYQLRREKDKF